MAGKPVIRFEETAWAEGAPVPAPGQGYTHVRSVGTAHPTY
ncbi:MAG: hypothetical protein ACYS80_21065 [Planctomycetota bacterium]